MVKFFGCCLFVLYFGVLFFVVKGGGVIGLFVDLYVLGSEEDLGME